MHPAHHRQIAKLQVVEPFRSCTLGSGMDYLLDRLAVLGYQQNCPEIRKKEIQYDVQQSVEIREQEVTRSGLKEPTE